MEHLIEAVIANNVQQVRQLLDTGLDPNGWEDRDKVRPLHFAAQYNSLESAVVLLQAGANLQAQTAEGVTPVEVAILQQHPAMIELLEVEAGKLVK